MAASIQIRPLEERDVPAVTRILAECYRLLAALIEMCASNSYVRQLPARFEVSAAELGHAVVGFVAIRAAVINELFVLPEFHRHGVGSALFRHATARMRERGHARVTLTTTGYGRPFYETMGMRVTGTVSATCGPRIGRELVLLEGPV